MKFLFVDYDQGTNGEWFCSKISEAPHCERLQWLKFGSRYKVKDCFDQEFLKFEPDWESIYKKHSALPESADWRIIPTHSKFSPVFGQFADAKILRIVQPSNQMMLLFTKYQRITKVWLSQEPNDSYFLGLIKIMYKKNNSIDFLKKIHRGMDNISLMLLENNVDPTKEAKARHIAKFLTRHRPEDKNFRYDALLPYEFLIDNHNAIVDIFVNNFDIHIADIDLSELSQHYSMFLQWADVECLTTPEKALKMAQHLIDNAELSSASNKHIT